MSEHRFAVYWAPPEGTMLHRLGAQWLGRDPATGEAIGAITIGINLENL